MQIKTLEDDISRIQVSNKQRTVKVIIPYAQKRNVLLANQSHAESQLMDEQNCKKNVQEFHDGALSILHQRSTQYSNISGEVVFKSKFGLPYKYDFYKSLSQTEIQLMKRRMKHAGFPGAQNLDLRNNGKKRGWNDICRLVGLSIPKLKKGISEY